MEALEQKTRREPLATIDDKRTRLEKFFFQLCSWRDEADLSTLKVLVEKDMVRINIKDKKRQTALFHASTLGNVEAVKILVKNGADITLRNINHIGPFGIALHKVFTQSKEKQVDYIDICKILARRRVKTGEKFKGNDKDIGKIYNTIENEQIYDKIFENNSSKSSSTRSKRSNKSKGTRKQPIFAHPSMDYISPISPGTTESS
jgi:hypothetical protein